MMDQYKIDVTYSGSWKLDGYSSNHKTFRDGMLDLVHDTRSWKCLLRLLCDPKRVIKSCQLTSQIKDVICGKRIILELKSGDNIHLQLVEGKKEELFKKLKLIKENKLQIPNDMENCIPQARTPVQRASATIIRSQSEDCSPPGKERPTSPNGQFTGGSCRVKVKVENSRSPASDSGPMDIPSPPPYDIACSRKEVSQNYLTKSQLKSHEALENVSTQNFYGSSPRSTMIYSSSYPRMESTVQRRPGLLPDPMHLTKPAGMSPTFSWLTKSPGSAKQPAHNNLQGFSNLGNTCYMNAILQSIFGLDMFTTDLIQSADRVAKQLEVDEKKSCLLNVLMNLFLAKKSNSSTDQKRQLLAEVKRNISSSAKRFSGYEQHDAHEFLGQVLDQLKEEMDKINKQIAVKSEETTTNTEKTETNDKNPTVSNFEFKVTHTITCSNCGTSVNNLETFNDMSVDIPPTRALEATWSIQDALDLTFLPEDVDYTCEQCGGKEAIVKHKFSMLPRVLIIHLKRYNYSKLTFRNMKLGQNLIIPRYLTLQSQCTEETTPAQPAPEPAEALFKPAKFNMSQANRAKILDKKLNNTPKRRLDLDGKEPERDTSLRKAIELNSNNHISFKTGPRRVRNSFPQENGATDESDCFINDVIAKSPSAAPSDKKFAKESFIPESMTEDEMMRLAMERSMEDNPVPKEVSFTGINSDENKSSPEHQQAMPYKGENGSPDNPGTDTKTILDACTNGPDTSSPKCEHTNVDHNYVAQEPDSLIIPCSQNVTSRHGLLVGPLPVGETRRGLNLEPPNKRPKIDDDDCDEAYDLFTDIEKNNSLTTAGDNVNVLNGSRHELNSSGVDMNVSDEENKENYTPPSVYSPTTDVGSDPIKQEVNKQEVSKPEAANQETVKQEDGEIKLGPEEGYDEETQLRLAIENSLKDLESMDLQQGLDDDLEKAKQLSLQDAENDAEPFVITPQRPKDKRDLKRTKAEEQALKDHAEKGELPYSYQLVSVVSHIGNSSVSGHYISDTYDMNRRTWLSWNDSHGQHIDWEEIRRERERTGYIFFYVANEVVTDTENYYFHKRSRVRSHSLSALPVKRLTEIPDRPSSAIKCHFKNTRLELR